MLRYLKAHPEVYTKLDEHTTWMKSALMAVADRLDVPLRVKAIRSIFTVSFSHRDVQFYREIMGGSDYKASIALAYYMRKHGVYMPELHFLALSYAHTREDLEIVLKAFEISLQEMKDDGFFVS